MKKLNHEHRVVSLVNISPRLEERQVVLGHHIQTEAAAQEIAVPIAILALAIELVLAVHAVAKGLGVQEMQMSTPELGPWPVRGHVRL